ncbi:BlaI/MecI/CopY family transcriptional regulator [Mediterraneibacter agrestimuris]|uniref:BlaI/MecI/CopY family transcriptional regulator n=1 Tax=Mediterraneibacter agrestimuris TaxID=2941333 RepID=UPI00204025D4|nr:BlaI/MecI/CopY family transcriptional regulator [Mediterraneibacter agrestimuris]
MKKKYDLTNTEMEIMDFLWIQEKDVSFKEILTYANEKLHKDWKRQTLSTYLKNLQMAGLVKAIDSKKNYSYYAACTKEEHIHKWTKDLVKKSYGNSIERFMVAFSGGKKLDKEVADQLRKLL